MWYAYTIEFYSVIKKNEILSFAGKWMKLRTSSLLKIANFRSPKTTCVLSFVEYRPNTNTLIL
jgi:hypothetical protein